MKISKPIILLTILSTLINYTISQQYYQQGYGGGGRQYYQQQQQRQKPKRPFKEDFYKILGLPHGADYKVVKKTFKTLALKLHPDKVKEEEREAAKSKFEKITEAYDILSDAGKKSVYDAHGHEGLEEYDENQNMNERNKAQREQYEEQKKEQIQHQDFFEDSEVLTISITSMTRFYRRINVWLIFFYKGDEQQAQRLQPTYKDLAKKYYGIFEIAAVNCAEDEEICQELGVQETPRLYGFRSNSNQGIKFGDDGASIGSASVGKMAMFSVNLMDDFVSIVTDSNYTEFANKNPLKLKIVLFTDKTMTPALFKTLSKEFRNTVDFGLLKKSSTEQISNFKIETFPQVMILKSILDYTGIFMEEAINKDSIVEFIRKNVEKVTAGVSPNKITDVKLLNSENYNSGFCGKDDKIICVLLVAKEGSDYLETMESIKTHFIADNMNFFITNRSYLDLNKVIDSTQFSSNLDNTEEEEYDEYVEVLIIKGSKGRYSYYRGYGDEESLKNYIDRGISQQFKKMLDPLQEGFVFSEETDL